MSRPPAVPEDSGSGTSSVEPYGAFTAKRVSSENFGKSLISVCKT